MQNNYLLLENKRLKQEIVQLQDEICLRTRNFLLQSNKNKHIVRCYSKQVQCQPFFPDVSFFARSFKKEDKLSANPFLTDCAQFESSSKSHSNGFSLSFTPERIDPDENKIKDRSGNAPIESSSVSSQDSSFNESSVDNSPQATTFLEIKLTKKIDKLIKKLNKEKKMNSITREGLLLSQEENYKFRLIIKDLNQKIQSLETQLYRISISEDARKEITNSIYKLKKQNQLLLIENSELKRYINKLQNIKEPYTFQTIKQYEAVIEIIKEKTYIIGNNILQNDYQEDQSYFRPTNKNEIISTLNRIQYFSRVFKKWEQEKWQLISNQKSKFLQFIEALSTKNCPITKQMLILELDNLSSIKPYAEKLLNKSHTLRIDETTTNLIELSPNNDLKYTFT